MVAFLELPFPEESLKLIKAEILSCLKLPKWIFSSALF
jgi:hypothetical protein